MKEMCVKTLVPIIVALVGAFGAHSCRLEYISAENETAKGRLVMTMMKDVCTQERAHAPTPEP